MRLAIRLGLRNGDICILRFSQIDWNNDRIVLEQEKTGITLSLPLLEDVGNSIMEYIIHERPTVNKNYPYVFVRARAPHKKLSSMYSLCSKILDEAGVRTVNSTSRGVHVCRYTLTHKLLKAKIPHQFITDTFGHVSKESKKPYLSMEEEMLRECPLDFSLIGQKRASGYPYIASAKILGYLDSLIVNKFPASNTLTKEICDVWITECPCLHQNTLLRRITPVRQYAKYLIGTGTMAYIIPGKIPNKQIHYDAHIFIETELIAFFAVIDQCPRSPFSPVRCYVIPVFFRLLYTCGLRSSEARCLKVVNVDLDTGEIFIRETKGWESRIIYVSNDLLDLLGRYNTIIEKILPGCEAFFPNKEGHCYSNSTIDVWFHEFWDLLPEAATSKGNSPRVHDFRHSYCVYRLNQWVRENKDLNALYSYLSEFVGHQNL